MAQEGRDDRARHDGGTKGARLRREGELEALGSTGPLYNSKTIESAAPVTYPRASARGRTIVLSQKISRVIRKKESVITTIVIEKERMRDPLRKHVLWSRKCIGVSVNV